MNEPNFHLTEDYIALVARERQASLTDDAARRRAARVVRRDTTRTRSRFLRWR